MKKGKNNERGIKVMAKKNEVVVACVEGDKLADVVNNGCTCVGLGKLLDAKIGTIKADILNRMSTEAVSDSSVRLVAQQGSVLVSKAESFEIDATVPKVKGLIDAGALPFVEKTERLTISSDNIKEIKTLLGDILFAKFVTVATNYNVDPEKYREFVASGNEDVKAVVVPNMKVSANHRFTFAPSATAVQEGEGVISKIGKTGQRVLELA